MKLNERLALLKAGYSKAEIDQLVKEDQEAVEEIQPEEAPGTDKYMDVIKALAGEVKSLKDAVHASNIENAEAVKQKPDDAVDVLMELFNAPEKEKK